MNVISGLSQDGELTQDQSNKVISCVLHQIFDFYTKGKNFKSSVISGSILTWQITHLPVLNSS